MKKILSLLLALVLLASVAPVTVRGAGSVKVNRVGVNLPDIYVELEGTDYDLTEATASLGGETLTLEGLPAVYNQKIHSSRAYMLVDLSRSINDSEFAKIKNLITEYINGMGAKDSLVLITIGDTSEVVLNGSEDQDTRLNKVQELVCDQNNTSLYEALNEAYSHYTSSPANFDRQYVLLFSDCENDRDLGETQDEIIDCYSDTYVLPIYVACTINTTRKNEDTMGMLARASGGEIFRLDKVKELQDLKDQINDVTLLHFKAPTNRAEEEQKMFRLTIGEDNEFGKMVMVIGSQADEEAPEVLNIQYDAEKNAFLVCFTEPVMGANITSAYKVTCSGKTLKVKNVFYRQAEGIYEVSLEDEIYNGTYTWEFSGITDVSQEKNILATESFDCEVDTSIDPPVPTETQKETEPVVPDEPDKPDTAVIIIIALVAVVLIAVLVVVIVVATKKKPEEEEEEIIPVRRSQQQVVEMEAPSVPEVKYHLRANEAARIRLRIKTGKTLDQNIELDLAECLIVGRSTTCDIYIDDTKLSRQHFAIEKEGTELYLSDLQSRNGTMLNGVHVNGRRKLASGDKIMAGLSDITITIVGR